jgi:hypothetical protein
LNHFRRNTFSAHAISGKQRIIADDVDQSGNSLRTVRNLFDRAWRKTSLHPDSPPASPDNLCTALPRGSGVVPAVTRALRVA